MMEENQQENLMMEERKPASDNSIRKWTRKGMAVLAALATIAFGVSLVLPLWCWITSQPSGTPAQPSNNFTCLVASVASSSRLHCNQHPPFNVSLPESFNQSVEVHTENNRSDLQINASYVAEVMGVLENQYFLVIHDFKAHLTGIVAPWLQACFVWNLDGDRVLKPEAFQKRLETKMSWNDESFMEEKKKGSFLPMVNRTENYLGAILYKTCIPLSIYLLEEGNKTLASPNHNYTFFSGKGVRKINIAHE